MAARTQVSFLTVDDPVNGNPDSDTGTGYSGTADLRKYPS